MKFAIRLLYRLVCLCKKINSQFFKNNYKIDGHLQVLDEIIKKKIKKKNSPTNTKIVKISTVLKKLEEQIICTQIDL